MKIKLLQILLLMISAAAFGQRIGVEGKIIATQNVDVEGINVYNLTSKSGVITDEQGAFKIAVSLNDSISVSALHIQERILVIGEEQVKSKKVLIEISEKDNLLNAVRLRNSLTGTLGVDANTIPLNPIITATSQKLPNADLPQLTKSQRMLYTSGSGHVDLLVNTLTGERKRIKQRIELEKKVQITENLLAKIPMAVFVDVLKIQPFKVYEFLFFCESDPEYNKILKRPFEEIIQFLKIKSKEFAK